MEMVFAPPWELVMKADNLGYTYKQEAQTVNCEG